MPWLTGVIKLSCTVIRSRLYLQMIQFSLEYQFHFHYSLFWLIRTNVTTSTARNQMFENPFYSFFCFAVNYTPSAVNGDELMIARNDSVKRHNNIDGPINEWKSQLGTDCPKRVNIGAMADELISDGFIEFVCERFTGTKKYPGINLQIRLWLKT